MDSVLQGNFTPAAYKQIKDIPTVEGWLATTGYASGTSNWSSLMSFGLGTGIGRKVVFSQDSLFKEGYPGLVHEYLHHLDDMSRDDPEKEPWINLEVFVTAYKMLSQDHRYKGIQRWCESRANDWIPNTFGVGEYSEHLAYIGMYLASRDDKGNLKHSPDYMRAVFSRVLNLPYQKASVYTNLSGEQFLVTANPDKLDLIRMSTK